jgi:hypothetical protein
MVFNSHILANLMLLGYCANLAYVIRINEFSASCRKQPCHFGMVLFGIADLGLQVNVGEGQIWIIRSSSLMMTSIFLKF